MLPSGNEVSVLKIIDSVYYTLPTNNEYLGNWIKWTELLMNESISSVLKSLSSIWCVLYGFSTYLLYTLSYVPSRISLNTEYSMYAYTCIFITCEPLDWPQLLNLHEIAINHGFGLSKLSPRSPSAIMPPAIINVGQCILSWTKCCPALSFSFRIFINT